VLPGPIVNTVSTYSLLNSPAALKAGRCKVQAKVKKICSLPFGIGMVALYSTLNIKATNGWQIKFLMVRLPPL
jgi:hypothetical protein